MTSLKSSTEKVGKVVDQIIINNNGRKKTLRNIITSTIEEGSRVKMQTTDGRMYLVRDEDTWVVEVLPVKSECKQSPKNTQRTLSKRNQKSSSNN